MTDRLNRQLQRGVTLIELMVAMVLGLLVTAGITTVFLSTSSSNRAQTQMARLQEEGRFAISRLSSDLRMANGQYCTNTGGVALKPSAAGQPSLDGLRMPTVYANDLEGALADLTTPFGTDPYPATPAVAYYLPAYLFMRGYDCGKDADSCKAPADIPAMGKADKDRVVATDVLTLRYVDSSRGWALGGGNTTLGAASNDGGFNTVTLKQGPGEPDIGDFKANHLAMLADCSNAQIFAVSGSGATGTLGYDADKNFSRPTAQQSESAAKLFDVDTDFKTVTYYLEVVADSAGRTTGALHRRVNGGDNTKLGSDDELVRGVERLDFLYGVEASNGGTQFLTAAEVDSRKGGAIACPPSIEGALKNGAGEEPGCLWRAVKSIQVSLLMDGQIPLNTLSAVDQPYVYSPDGGDGGDAPTAPTGHAVQPNADQGFPNELLRREFTVQVAVRNYNP